MISMVVRGLLLPIGLLVVSCGISRTNRHTGPAGASGGMSAGRAGANSGGAAEGGVSAAGGAGRGPGAGAPAQGGRGGEAGEGPGGAPPDTAGAGGQVEGGTAGTGVDCRVTPILGSAPQLTTGADPVATALADFDGDGKLDLVIANSGADSVSVLLGLGNRRFSAKLDYATGDLPVALAVGDLDGDETPDVVVANQVGQSVSVLRGTGDGALAPAIDFPTNELPWALALGDLNADGMLDVVTAGSDSVAVRLGLGAGSLGVEQVYPVSGYPVALAIVDMNGDEKLDVVVTGWYSSLTLLTGDGQGALEEKGQTTITGGAVSAVVGDLDGTGSPAVVTLNAWTDSIFVVTSTDGELVEGPGFAVGRQPDFDFAYSMYASTALALADLNSDGRLDAVVANPAGTVSVLLGGAEKTFAEHVEYPTGGRPLSVAVGELSGDGKLDLAVTNGDSDTIMVLVGNGDGSFETEVARGDHPLPGTNNITAGALGDVDGDSKLDLVVLNYEDPLATGKATVLHGQGDGHFVTGASVPIEPSSSLALGDLSGDGALDLVVANSFGASISVWHGTGTGDFTARKDYPTDNAPMGVVLGDLNNDERLDVLVPDGAPGAVSVRLSLGDGTLGAQVNYAANAYPYYVATGDLNGDGNLDVVAAYSGYGIVSVLLGLGDGTFADADDYMTGIAYGLALGDLNGDDQLDIVTTFGGQSVSVLAGNGDGTFRARTDYPAGLGSGVKLGDVTADGRTDIILHGQSLTVMPNGPDGISDTKLEYVTGATGYLTWLALGDLDGDERTDMVFSATGNAVSVLLNPCP